MMGKTKSFDVNGNPDVAARLSADAAGIAEAARLLSAGKLVALPTETVYGLGADARQGEAVARIFEAKGRPRFNPLIVHVSDMDAARRLADFPPRLERLADAFWPGPLTLTAPLRKDSGLSDLVTAGLPTVALRVPAHPLAQKLLAAFGGPIAAPSANPSGKISPTTADHVLAGLGGRIAAVLDGGPCPVGLESTIVGLDGAHLRLLRPGGLSAEAIEACAGQSLHAPDTGEITAPGQLLSHYAPTVRLRLNAPEPDEGELFLGFGGMPANARGLDLSASGDLREAAAALFGHLHELDALAEDLGAPAVAVAPIPDTGLGRAINDRLARAAHR